VKLKPGYRVAHFAPEALIARRLHQLLGSGYEAYDINPARYKSRIHFTSVTKCDLCIDLDMFHIGSYDVVIHNHVMEHIPCNYVITLQKLQTLVKPGGVLIFSVPITRGYSSSNLNPGLTAKERISQFGQFDHLIKFGSLDHDMNLGMVFGHKDSTYHLEDILGEANLRGANIPQKNWRPSGSTVFFVRS
jgi:phosphoglycolate phosphatase